MAKIFISYSHRDEKALDRLHTHLAMLRREGLLEAWFDREILAGQEIDREIASNLDDSKIFIALTSADFLASNYCYERELKTALERHEAGSIVVIPVIVEACDWKASPLGKLKALPKEGRPISTWTNEAVAYLDVVTELRRILEKKNSKILTEQNTQSDKTILTSAQAPRRYRIKKEFDAIDRAEFAKAAFDRIREYFQQSIDEINQIGEPLRALFERMNESAFTCTVLNKASRNLEANITFHLQGKRSFGDIIYSFSYRAPDNTANGHLQIETDEYEQFLTFDGFKGSSRKVRLSAEEAAERIWREYISNAGIEHE
jgi:hypothetical protein